MEDGETEKKKLDKKKKRRLLRKKDIVVVNPDTAKKAVFASAVGNAMEWFDFGIYSYLAVIIGKVFFPEVSGSTQLVFAFATFSVAFLVRPLGGMFFGMLGDRLGRKNILAITLIIMAIATLSIGLIPSYESIGITASILLLVARLVQGFSTGGEYSGAMTFIAESSPDKKRGFMASGLEVGTLVGYICGAGLVTILTLTLGDETMLAWGWRIPFIIAAPIGFIGFYLRSNLEETPAFEAMEESKEHDDQASMKDIFVYHKKPMLIGIGLVLFYNVVDYMLLSYMPSHLSSVLGYGETKGLILILVVMFIMIPIVLLMGYVSDRIGTKRIIMGGLIGLLILAIPAFKLIESGDNLLVFLGLMILAVFLASFQGTMPSVLPSLFFTDVRYGGLSIMYNLSASVFGGTTPLVVAFLISQTMSLMVPAYYIMIVSVIGIIVVAFFVQETSGRPLRGSAPAVEEEHEIAGILNDQEEAQWWREEKQEITKRMENE
ncbi:glycine betaine/L-proline transporter ProP [Filibacter tadaridae]|uniref:Putative proline/betaine transporter n=1 Tax=Filibacter tadaridae TaxID=2483811 RepID=A0A3P5WKN9_9BACL|nr:glycine betaine/L-proline transporter ProP [Filibacter tadaridae]VDC24183.1 Proline/betaine transporter [Filibacter tadaridae]